MMKKVICTLLMGAMLSVTVTGCALSPKATDVEKQNSVKVEKTDWFKENGYTINEDGEYDFRTYVTYLKMEGIEIPEPVTLKGTVEITETDNGDGTKTVKAEFIHAPYVFEDGKWATARGYYMVADRYTGDAYVAEYYRQEEIFNVTYEDGTEVELKVYRDNNTVTNANMNKIESVEVVVPSDYDGVVIGFMGLRNVLTQDFWNEDYYNVKELVIQDENCDLIFWAD